MTQQTYPRFHVVVVGKYLGDYTNRFLCWAIADHELANGIVSRKYDDRAEAEAEADRLNSSETANK